MSQSAIDAATAREQAYSEPLETLNPASGALFQNDAMWPVFERLRLGQVHEQVEGDFPDIAAARCLVE